MLSQEISSAARLRTPKVSPVGFTGTENPKSSPMGFTGTEPACSRCRRTQHASAPRAAACRQPAPFLLNRLQSDPGNSP